MMMTLMALVMLLLSTETPHTAAMVHVARLLVSVTMSSMPTLNNR